MAIDLNDEIVQDFLVEAGEILETLNEQLVDLESQPDDMDMLNSVFRSFHTIKGGAGFLAINALVDVCHSAENIFDLLRKGERNVDSELMDVVLEVLDVVNDMFQSINQGEDPEPAQPALMESLKLLSVPQASQPSETVEETTEVESEQASVEADNESPAITADVEQAEKANDEISDDEFEDLLDQLQGEGKQTSNMENPATVQDENKTGNASEEIDDDEFEALLDNLHGKGKHNNAVVKNADTENKQDKPESSSEEITEGEFDQLLDEMQTQNKEGSVSGKVEKKSEQKSENIAAAKAEEKAKPARAPASKAATPKAETTVRVETSVLDRIMNMVGELVLLRNRLTTLETTIGNEEVSETVNNLDVVTSDLQTSVMKTRMQPIKKVFGRFPRVVRDLARSLNKEISLEMIGEDTDLDKNLVEALADPLIHLVRNSVDHGIEMPDDREAAGKAREGTVVLSAEQEGDQILLTIQDDGKGMDHNALRRLAVEKGLMDEDAAQRLDEGDCYNLIFMPGFSTKKEISDVSGRGVGMDVVKTRINQLNGTVNIHSKLGKGSTIEIRVPLTLAILPTLMVVLGDQKQVFALPLVSVNEIIDHDMDKINIVDGQKVVVVRGKPLPLFYLSSWLTHGCDEYNEDNGHIVVVRVGSHHIALLVDRLLGREEVVIKPLGAMLQGTKGLAGATITGDGKIALILDLPDLLQTYANHY